MTNILISLLNWLLENIAWEGLRAAFYALGMAGFATAIASKIFGIIRGNARLIFAFSLFFGFAFLFALLIFSVSQPGPKLEARIEAVAYGGHSDDGKIKSPVALIVSIVNSGNMSTIVRDWSLTL
jgi:hypothetical protein